MLALGVIDALYDLNEVSGGGVAYHVAPFI
jgi:hypothetical protein